MISEGVYQEKILKQIDLLKSELIQLTQDLVRIPSVSGEEKEAQSFVHSKLKEIGFEVQSHTKAPSRPNLVAKLESPYHGKREDSKNLLFIAHIDNIPAGNRESWRYDPYSAQLADGRIFGRGVADMKAALAAMIIAAKAIRDSDIETRGTLSIASVVDEEIDSAYGMKYLADNKLLQADSSIFGEPSFPYVVTALKGGVWLKLVTSGKKVGSGWPSEGINAVTKMAKVLCELDRLDIASGTEEHPLLGRPTIALGTTITGGDAIHSIPDKCEATVEIYTIPGQSSKDVISKVELLLNNLRKSDEELSVRLETLFEIAPTITETNEGIYLDLQSSISSVFGDQAEPIGIPSIGDARFMTELGIPTIIAYGPGEKGKGHVANESVSIETLTRVAKVFALTALRFWRSSAFSKHRRANL
jgi:succinyl-diaminopimelate desuccinylase